MMHVSYHALRVMRQFLMEADPQCGAEIIRALELGSGTVYPMLARMESTGWLESAGTLPGVDVPPAHFYRLTPVGRDTFLAMLCRLTIPDHLWHEALPGGDE